MASSFTDAFLIPSALSSATAPAASSWPQAVDLPPPAAAPTVSPTAAAGPVLDAIDAAGKDGASVAAVALITGHSEPFIEQVLDVLKTNRMVEISSDAGAKIARLTDFGAKARYLITR